MDDYCESWGLTDTVKVQHLLSAFSIFVQSDIIVMWMKDFRHFPIDWNDVRNGILMKMNRS